MSYIPYRQGCKDCHRYWNAACGMVGTTYIKQYAVECPYCCSVNLEYVGVGWTGLQPQEIPQPSNFMTNYG